MTTYEYPANLGDYLGAHHDGNFNTQTAEIKGAIGVLKRGTILAAGSGADAGKLVLLTIGTEAAAYGVLLNESIDTSAAFSNGSVTGSIARSGTFRAAALIIPTGVNAGLVSDTLREKGVFIEGVLVAPA
jgi:hypothetical protein